MENIHTEPPSADFFNSSFSRKVAEKRKHCSYISAVPALAASPPSKRARVPAPAASSMDQEDNPPGTASHSFIMRNYNLHQLLSCIQMQLLLLVLGFFFNNQWFADVWPKDLSSLPENASSAALMEMYPIVIAFLLGINTGQGNKSCFFVTMRQLSISLTKGTPQFHLLTDL